jgi:predicted nucleotidyltransferase
MPTSIQVSDRFRRKVARLKRHPREPYEDVLSRALAASAEPPLGTAPLRGPTAAAIAEFRAWALAEYGARYRRLILFGSVARGEARPDSDIDLLLVIAGPVNVSQEIDRFLDAKLAIDERHGVMLQVVPMSEHDYLTRATPLLLNVRREGVPV